MPNLLWAVIAVLVVLWVLGFSLHIAGGLIHTLLVVAVIVFLARLILGRWNN